MARGKTFGTVRDRLATRPLMRQAKEWKGKDMQDTTYGQTAATYLLADVRDNYPARAVERIELWLPVITEAYSATFAGDFNKTVHVPSHIGEAGNKAVEAREILQNFNNWLGGAVWDALYRVWDEQDITYIREAN